MSCKNILLITSDQQHYNTLGIDNPEIETPNLDRLAREGMLFDRAYCPNPTCTPTRASIITGLYPSQHGAWSLGTKLPESVPTLGGYLGQSGRRTALIGKAHFQPIRSTPEYPSLESMPLLQDLSFWKNFHGPFYGFDHVELARNHTNEFLVGQHYALWMEENGCKNWRDYFTPPTGTMDPAQKYHWDIPEEYHYDAWIAQRSCAMLEQYQKSGQPFFLWSSFFDPHPDYLAPSPWDTMYSGRSLTVPCVTPGEHRDSPPHHRLTQQENPDFSAYRESGMLMHGMHSHVKYAAHARRDMEVYYGMISLMDKYIGKILDKLDALGLREDTLVVFTTDHGHLFGQHGLYAKGAFLYEDMIRVPMVARCPGLIEAGSRTHAMQSLVDLAPTFLDLLGEKIPYHMTGVSQKDVWSQKAPAARTSILCENHHEPTTIQQRAYVDERYKLVVYQREDSGEMYDLAQDPGEIHNLWYDPAYAALRGELLLRYARAELARESKSMPRIANA